MFVKGCKYSQLRLCKLFAIGTTAGSSLFQISGWDKISDAYDPPEQQNKDCLLVTRPKTTIHQRRGQGTEFI